MNVKNCNKPHILVRLQRAEKRKGYISEVHPFLFITDFSAEPADALLFQKVKNLRHDPVI